MISWFVCFLFFILLVITGAHRLLVIVRNSQRTIKKLNSYMNPRLSGYISVSGLVFYVLKSLLGIKRQLSRENFAIFVLTQLLVPVPPEC